MSAVTDLRKPSVPMPADLYDRLERIAQSNERKVAAEIRVAVREYVERVESAERASETAA